MSNIKQGDRYLPIPLQSKQMEGKMFFTTVIKKSLYYLDGTISTVKEEKFNDVAFTEKQIIDISTRNNMYCQCDPNWETMTVVSERTYPSCHNGKSVMCKQINIYTFA